MCILHPESTRQIERLNTGLLNMAKKPQKTLQTLDLDQSIQIALDAADASMDVTAEFERISSQFEGASNKVEALVKTGRIGIIAAGCIAFFAILIMGVIWQRSSSGLERLTATNSQLLSMLTENVAGFDEKVAEVATLSEQLDVMRADNAALSEKINEIAVLAEQISDLHSNVAMMSVSLADFETSELAEQRTDQLTGVLGDRIATLNGELAMNVSVTLQETMKTQMETYTTFFESISEAAGSSGNEASTAALEALQKNVEAQMNDLSMRINQMRKTTRSSASAKRSVPEPDVIKFP